MIFCLTNIKTGKSTHVGVLEFTAEEGICYAPQWIFNTLSFEIGQDVRVKF